MAMKDPMKIRINVKVDDHEIGDVYDVSREEGMKLCMDGKASEVEATTPVDGKKEQKKVVGDAVKAPVKADHHKSVKVDPVKSTKL